MAPAARLARVVVGSPFPRKLRTGLLVGLVVGILAVFAVRYRPVRDPDKPAPASSLLAWIEGLELRFHDLMARQHARGAKAAEDIVFVTIDDESIARLRQSVGPWPWSRETLGNVAVELHLLGAKLIVLDETFDQPSPAPGDDGKLAALLEKAGEVVLGFRFTDIVEEQVVRPGRWALRHSAHRTRADALRAASALLAKKALPYLVGTEPAVELWLGGFRDRSTAVEASAALLESASGKELQVRELTAEETLHRVTGEAVFAERNAVGATAATGSGLSATFRALHPPVPALVASPARFGSVELQPDHDGVVRAVRHLVKYEGRYYPSLGLAAWLALSGADQVSLADGRLSAGGKSVPIDPNAFALLRFYSRPDASHRVDEPYPSVPVFSVLKSASRRAAGRSIDSQLAERVMNKVVFLHREQKDERMTTPVGASPAGPIVAAASLENLRRGESRVRASTDYDSALALGLALLGALLSVVLTRSSRMRRTAVFEALGSLLVAGAFATFANQAWRSGLWIGVVVPLGAFVVALSVSTAINFADESKVGSLIREALGRGISTEIVEKLLRNPQLLALEGEQRLMTSWVLDVCDFQRLSQSMKPRAIVHLMSELFTEVSEAVADTRGQIDKMVGDSVVAFWGAPLPNHCHALDACRCALQVRDLLARRRASWKSRYGVELRARAGVCSGDLVVGEMGARGGCPRVHFTVLGEAIGLARRLERQNKEWGTEILLSESTFELVREEVEAREIDLLRVPGRQRPIRIFELMGLKGGLDKEQRELIETFEKALIAYRRRDFQEAIATLTSLAMKHPSDGPTNVYLDRCRAYLRKPPADEWDGVWDGAAQAKAG